jgi:tetratricopeptide (TPR) repeat protein
MHEQEKSQTKELTVRLTAAALSFQCTLKKNPRHPQALIGMSLVALASRQPEAAVKMAATAVSVAPQMGTAWVTLGQALKADKRNGEAEQAYTEAIRLDGMDPLARVAMGELKIAAGRPEESIKEYELAIQRQPALAAAHLGLGHALTCMGQFEEALDRYRQTLALSPRLAEAEFASGYVLVRLRRLKEAEARYRRALTLRPDFAAAWSNMGSLLREQGREIYAEAALQRAVQLRPDLIGAWLNLAHLEMGRRQMDKAKTYLRKAFALDPGRIDMHIAWCQFCSAEHDMAGAWEWLRWALTIEPDNAEVVNMHGILLHNEHRFPEAIEVFTRAEELGCRAASSNRGNSLLDLGRVEEALRAHEKAVEQDPECAGAHYNLAMTRLRVGDWKRGWPEYEARWDFREVHRLPRTFRQPRWKGEPLDGRRILLHAEQGLGDSIQFCRYVPLVVARGGSVLLQVQTGVKRLIGSLAVVQTGLAEIAQLGEKPPEFDLECPLMSLPAVFGTTLETAPWSGAYLSADPALVREKWAMFPDARRTERCLRVGLAWAGNPGYKADRERSMKLKTLRPLLRTPDITWISLQKGDPVKQLADLPDNVFVWDGCSEDRDLADTAALIAALDLVITTDTCIAHLAGAMGKPVWILLPHLADWRWMLQIETTPWYPTARLFRQSVQGDWSQVIERVIASLRAFPQPAGAMEFPLHYEPAIAFAPAP